MTATDAKLYMESAITEVLEGMCFLSVEGETDENAGQLQPDWLCGELDFVGHPSGKFGIAAPPSVAAVMAGNFLGEDKAILTNEQILEVICECANMVCGALLSHMDTQKTFTLSSPRHDLYSSLNIPLADRICGSYRLNEGLIYSWIEIREAA